MGRNRLGKRAREMSEDLERHWPPFGANIRNFFQATPLHRAAAKGHAQVVQVLLENGAHVDARDKFFNTPLHMACKNGREEATKTLLQWGASPIARAQGGVTPLLCARGAGVHAIIEQALVEAGEIADPTGSRFYSGIDKEAKEKRHDNVGGGARVRDGAALRSAGKPAGARSDGSSSSQEDKAMPLPNHHPTFSTPKIMGKRVGPRPGAVNVRTLPKDSSARVYAKEGGEEEGSRGAGNLGGTYRDSIGLTPVPVFPVEGKMEAVSLDALARGGDRSTPVKDGGEVEDWGEWEEPLKAWERMVERQRE
ncbi:unnamed protein product, partial [Discosporangium mesarthrocarpum]